MKKTASIVCLLTVLFALATPAIAGDNFLMLRQELAKNPWTDDWDFKTFNVFENKSLEPWILHAKFSTGRDWWEINPGIYYKFSNFYNLRVGVRYIHNNNRENLVGAGLAQAGEINSHFFFWEALYAFGLEGNTNDFIDLYGQIEVWRYYEFSWDIAAGIYDKINGSGNAYFRPCRLRYRVNETLTLFVMGEVKEYWPANEGSLFSPEEVGYSAFTGAMFFF